MLGEEKGDDGVGVSGFGVRDIGPGDGDGDEVGCSAKIRGRGNRSAQAQKPKIKTCLLGQKRRKKGGRRPILTQRARIRRPIPCHVPWRPHHPINQRPKPYRRKPALAHLVPNAPLQHKLDDLADLIRLEQHHRRRVVAAELDAEPAAPVGVGVGQGVMAGGEGGEEGEAGGEGDAAAVGGGAEVEIWVGELFGGVEAG